jgi:Uma2 family endonuclease
MVAQVAPTTAAELFALGDDGRYELFAGEPRERVSPNYDHYRITGRLNGFLFVFVNERGIGDIGPEPHIVFEVEPDTVLVPDLAFYLAERAPEPGNRTGLIRVVPDLVIEVLSPDNTAEEIDAKVQIYLRAGVPLVWVFNPRRRSATIYGADGTIRHVLPGGVLDGGDVLPGFTLAIDRIFR